MGLIPLALVLGYLLELASRAREGHPRPLPRWDDYGGKLRRGGHLLLALVVYNLPLLVMGGGGAIFTNAVAGGLAGDLIGYVVACCITPMGLLYTAITWPLLVTGIARTIETGQPNQMYRILTLWAILRRHHRLAGQWLLNALIVNVALVILMLIPCLGWVAALSLVVPVHGHLLGQYARQLGTQPLA